MKFHAGCIYIIYPKKVNIFISQKRQIRFPSQILTHMCHRKQPIYDPYIFHDTATAPDLPV